DGRPDVAVTVPLSDTVYLLRANDGRVRFADPVNWAAGNAPQDSKLADLDLDGQLDLVVTNPDKDVINRLLGGGAGGFGVEASFAAGAQPWAVELADLEGDGALDAVIAAFNSGALEVLLGDGQGNFAAAVATPAMASAATLILRDLSGDG